MNTVRVCGVDGTFWNLSDDSEEWVWMIEPEPSENVEFGDEVFLRVDPDTGATNAVSFTMVDFHPGEVSTFALREFELKGAQATSKAITNLRESEQGRRFRQWYVDGDDSARGNEGREWKAV